MRNVTQLGNWMERCAALGGLTLCAPILAAAALATLIEDGKPVFFAQQRVGRNGKAFRLWKLRSMKVRTDAGQLITASGDARITRVGAVLRKYKVDELPQLWNVCRGEMSLIGPRPEVPEYVDSSDPMWRKVLSIRPGLTDLSTLMFRNEEEVLAGVTDPDCYYRTVLLPDKLRLAWCYQQSRNLKTDVHLLLATVLCSISPSGFSVDRIKRTFLKAESNA